MLTDGTWTYTWQNGRELAAMTDGTTTWNYTYDANGMRTSRTNGTTTYNYVYNGSQLTQMTVGNDTLYFTYGVLGPITVTWNGETYYYALNGQGDVTGIFDGNGTLVVTYAWDNAWGYNPIPEGVMASTLGELNPLRYRSYVYDTETGYYYLQSRYYDPEIGRFINADGLVATGQGLLGNNMFAYCLNNPAFYADESGDIPQAVTDKIVHDMVLAHICANQANLSWTGTCIYYNGEDFWGGWGFCDLYNTQTGEVWELKKNSGSYSCRTSTALGQLTKYTNGRLKDNKKLKLHMPYKTTINSGSFSFTQNGYIYDVSYWSEGNGILRYTYDRRKTEERKTAEAVVTILAIATLVIVAPYAVPAYGGAAFGATVAILA